MLGEGAILAGILFPLSLFRIETIQRLGYGGNPSKPNHKECR